ncbi:MAG: glycosyltransferase family 4 protein [Limisphaerales bacterium]
MKLGISTSVVQRGKTGIAQYLFGLIRAFQRHTDEHEFVLFVLKEDLPLFDFAASYTRIIEVPEVHRPAVKNILWHQSHLPKLAAQHQLDVLHIPSYRRMLWPRPCALVSTIHDLAPFHVSDKYDWKRMLYGKVVVKRLAHRQQEIIAISQNTGRDIQRFFGVPPEKISVIHNGIDHDRFTPASTEAARHLVAEKHALRAPFFLYVARLEHPAKNHVRLIEAFERFKEQTGSDWQLVFGGSDWHGAEEIHNRIRQSPVANHIRSLGFVPAELPSLYRAASCFIYPSLFEGFGMPPIEAMACGCPVISSSRGSLEEVVGDAAIIIDPENVTQMSDQMKSLASDNGLRERLRNKGLEHAQRFTWARAAEETLRIYAQAATGIKPAPSNIVALPAPTGSRTSVARS